MKNQKNLFMLLLGVLSLNVNAQDTDEVAHNVVIQIPNVALLDLEAVNSTSITLGPTAPSQAGAAVDFGTGSLTSNDSSIWINYSSIIGSTTAPSRNVKVQITNGTVPPGTELSVLASEYQGTGGDGTMGIPEQSAVILDATPRNVITGIGSAYTGDGVNKGHNLTYGLRLASATGSYALLDFDNTETVEITYTLTDN